MEGWVIVVENLIREAVEQGKFDNLMGKGKPLDLARNPFEDPLAPTFRRILRDNGATHPLIEARRTLEEDAAEIRERLRLDWESYRRTGRTGDWERAVAKFRHDMGALNRHIRLNNLRVDLPNFHVRTVDLEAEIRRLCGSPEE